jgi:serine/threonine protein kinase
LEQAAASLNKKLTPSASAEDQGSQRGAPAATSPPDLSLIEEVKDIRSLFVFDKKIGEGKFGTVFLAHPRGDPRSAVAIKLIPQKSFSNRIEKELAMLKSIQHENIIRYMSAYRDKAFFYIVTEYCEGGELFQKIVDQGGIDELEACGIISQLLSALKVLHDGTYCQDDASFKRDKD